MWERLKGQPLRETAIPNYNHLLLRARVNSQRHYEVYTCEATDGITAEDIREMFNNSPNEAAKTIRRLGHCMHSDRATNDRVLIT